MKKKSKKIAFVTRKNIKRKIRKKVARKVVPKKVAEKKDLVDKISDDMDKKVEEWTQ